MKKKENKEGSDDARWGGESERKPTGMSFAQLLYDLAFGGLRNSQIHKQIKTKGLRSVC